MIALIAHDRKKEDRVHFVRNHLRCASGSPGHQQGHGGRNCGMAQGAASGPWK
jgi:methylglyoxal synthase